VIRFASQLSIALLVCSTSLGASCDSDRIERLWTKCAACHTLSTEKEGASIGPPLDHIVGRAAGKYAGYKYSKAFSQLTFAWDEATLDRFLENPQSMVPGTAMAFPGLRRADDRAELIRWLAGRCKDTQN
jgi:cytochrome c